MFPFTAFILTHLCLDLFLPLRKLRMEEGVGKEDPCLPSQSCRPRDTLSPSCQGPYNWHCLCPTGLRLQESFESALSLQWRIKGTERHRQTEVQREKRQRDGHTEKNTRCFRAKKERYPKEDRKTRKETEIRETEK